MSTDPDSSDSWDNNETHSQFSVPCCTMCIRREKSRSYCTTCKQYLCSICDCAHKMMVCFATHRINPLDSVDNVETLERILRTAESDSESESSPIEVLTTTVRTIVAWQFWQGSKYVDSLMKTGLELKKSLDTVNSYQHQTIAFVNDVHRQYQYLLKSQRDDIIKLLNGEFGVVQDILVQERDGCNLKISETLLKLSNYKLNNEENATGVDLSRAFNLPLPSIRGTSQWGNGCSETGSVFTLNGEEQSDKTATTGCNNNVSLYDSFNIPFVASEPSNLKCYVNPDLSLSTTDPDSFPNTNHVKTMQIYKTFGQKGNSSGQFNSPHGFCLGLDEDIVVADSSNHRVQIFDKNGEFKFQFGVAGRHDGYLWHPRKVSLLPVQRRYVVCDRGYERSRMQIFTETGKFVKKVFIQYIDIVAGIAVTPNEDIVVVDSVTPTVFIIGQHGFLRSIDCTGFMEEPSDITVAGKEFYICDFKSHSVVVIDEEGNLLRKFGDKRTTMFPNGIDLSISGYVLTGDSHGNFFHVVVYKQDGTFVSEFRCPYVKVSRCCGLKITTDGKIVTVDKNYHHVIMLEALCVTDD